MFIRVGVGQTYQLNDLTWAVRGAQDLLAGRNPYRNPTLGPGHDYPADAALFYPLPTVLAVLPLAPLSQPIAGAIFAAVSTTILAYALRTRIGVSGILILATPAFINGLGLFQWAPLLVGLTLLWPRASAVGFLKPHLGIALFAAYPSLRGGLVAAVVTLASLLVLPSWPFDWRANVVAAQVRYTPPLLTLPFGPLILLAALGWREPIGRLVLALACVPQRLLFYDQLPLLLAAQTVPQRVTLVAAMWAAQLGWVASGGSDHVATNRTVAQWAIAGCYVPAAAVIAWNTWAAKRRLRAEVNTT